MGPREQGGWGLWEQRGEAPEAAQQVAGPHFKRGQLRHDLCDGVLFGSKISLGQRYLCLTNALETVTQEGTGEPWKGPELEMARGRVGD